MRMFLSKLAGFFVFMAIWIVTGFVADIIIGMESKAGFMVLGALCIIIGYPVSDFVEGAIDGKKENDNGS